jgi:hypothetical protein
MSSRSTEEVFLDHLERAQQGDVEGDIRHSFSPRCVLLTSYGTFRGHPGVREAAALLERQIGPARYEYRNRVCEAGLAFLEWSADTPKASISDGADSFVIRRGKIVAMTIHYTVQPKDPGTLLATSSF